MTNKLATGAFALAAAMWAGSLSTYAQENAATEDDLSFIDSLTNEEPAIDTADAGEAEADATVELDAKETERFWTKIWQPKT